MAKFDLEAQLDQEYAHEANLLFDALITKGATYAERTELEAAGVAQHRIDALYPYNFADIIPAIKAYVELDFLDGLDPDVRFWDALTVSIHYHMDQYPRAVAEQARAAMQDLITDHYEEYNDLWAHVRDCLMGVTENRAHGANSMLHALMHVCWLMNRTRRTTQRPLNYRRDYKLFIHVIQQVLPALHAEVLAAV